jgi:hypothetical protein
VSALPAAVPSAAPTVSADTVRIVSLISSALQSNGAVNVLLARCVDNKT